MPPTAYKNLSGSAILAIALTALVLISPTFFHGQISGNDFNFHIASWMEVVHQWHQHVLFPSWAAGAYNGFGEPRFIFYPPLSWLAGHADSHRAVAKVHALPLYYGWTAVMALRPDGEAVCIPYENEPGDVEVINDEVQRNLGLFRATKLHPDLRFLIPSRPADARDCPLCRGTGKAAFQPGYEHLADSILCYCGGLGWLPHSAKL